MEKTICTQNVFRGRLLGVDVLEVEVAPGQIATREIVRHPGAVAVVAELPGGQFLFVRQYRKPVEQEVLEIVAGCLHKGETPEACAVREIREETGYEVRELTKLGVLFTTPGYSDEKLHIFHAVLHVERKSQRLDSDEKIEVMCFSESEVESMIGEGIIRDAKTLAGWLLFSCRR